MAQQIHEGECNVVDDIDVAKLGVELDTVEGSRHVVDENDVGQVQVAMALAHPPAVATLLPQWREQRRLEGQPLHQIADHDALGSQPLERRAHHAGHVIRPAPVAVGRSNLGLRVQCRDALRQRVDVRRQERAVGKPLAQQCARREAAHAQRVLDRCAVIAQPRILRRATDRRHFEIDRWRKAPVQAQLLGAEMAPLLEAAEVEEAEADRLLDLPRGVTCQQHPRDVRLDQLRRHAAAAQLKTQRLHQDRRGGVSGFDHAAQSTQHRGCALDLAHAREREFTSDREQ